MSTAMPIPEPARSRIVRITNVHFKATDNDIEKLFSGYAIEDIFRTVNTRTGKKSIAYILFGTVAEKNGACGLTGLQLRSRDIAIQPAHDGNFELNDDGTAFIIPEEADTTTTEAKAEESLSFDNASFPFLGTSQGNKSCMESASAPTFGSSVIETTSDAASGDELAACTSSLSLESTQREESIDAIPAIIDKSANQSETSTVFDIQGDHEDPNRSLPIENAHPLFRAGDSVPPPPAAFKKWNLHGHDANDPSKSFPTAAGWYNFKANQFAKIEQKQHERGTNASRIANYKTGDDGEAEQAGEQ